MSEILSPDRIAQLVEAAKQGQLPEQQSGGSRRSHRLRTVDFSRPTKFTNDHQRRITRATETFCVTAATRLSAELRVPIELETINSTQLTWSAAQAQLPPGSMSVELGVEPIGTKMLLAVEEGFVLMTLECLLGGVVDKPPRKRRLSEIDSALTRRLVESIAHQLSLVWHDLGGVRLAVGEIEDHQDLSQVAAVSEPTFVVQVEARINKHSSTLTLLIPWVAIEPIALRVAGRDPADNDPARSRSSAIEGAVARAPVTLRAEVASCELPVEEVLSLAPGSVVRLGGRADRGIALFVEQVALGRAVPGANGPRRAVQVHSADGMGT